VARYEEGEQYLGLATGFEELDNSIEGLCDGELTFVTAYTSAGKTWFAVNVLLNILQRKKRVYFYSLEMRKSRMGARILGLMEKCNANKIFKGVLDNEFYEQYSQAKEEFKNFKLDIKSNTRNLEKIKYSILEQSLTKKPDLFMLDYIQNLERKNETEYDLMTRAGNELQDLAKKVNAPFLIVSQVSNEYAKNQKGSGVMSLKGSGGLGQVADNVIELRVENDEEEKSLRQAQGAGLDVKVMIKKSRNGYTGAFDLSFYGKTGEFIAKDLNFN
jgi:replicative DNA helicase